MKLESKTIPGPATLYQAGSFGYTKVEVKNVSIEVKTVSSCRAAVKVTYTVKGKRSPVAITLTSAPTLAIVEGHGHPAPPDGMEDTPGGGRVSRFDSFAPEYEAEARVFLAQLKASGAIVLDFHGYDAHTGELAS